MWLSPKTWSERSESNTRVPAPKAGDLPLDYAPIKALRGNRQDLNLQRPESQSGVSTNSTTITPKYPCLTVTDSVDALIVSA